MNSIEVLASKQPGERKRERERERKKREIFAGKTQEEYRAALGRFGLSGDVALQVSESRKISNCDIVKLPLDNRKA